MNNELKYILQGCLIVLLLFITAGIIKFCFSFKEEDNQIQSSGTIVNIDSSGNNSGEGRALFTANCASCHALNKDLTGPALSGVTERVPDKKLLHAWIRNSSKVLKSGDAYFNSLYKKYRIQMTSFPNLTDEQIDAILAYVTTSKARSELPPSIAEN